MHLRARGVQRLAPLCILAALAGCDASVRRRAPVDMAPAPPDVAQAQPRVCEPGTQSLLDCQSEVAHATVASEIRRCDEDGQTYTSGPCVLSRCEDGYAPAGGACVLVTCAPGAASADVSCTGEIAHATSATKTRTCNADGTAYEDGLCRLTACEAGYLVNLDDTCVPTPCPADMSLGLVDCHATLAHAAAATRPKSCNAEGTNYVYGVCTVSACEPGFLMQAGACVPLVCTPGAMLAPVGCAGELAHASAAVKSASCGDLGTDVLYGACVATACQRDYAVQGGACVQIPVSCAPDAVLGEVDCASTVWAATSATQARRCNASGDGYVYGACVVTSCDTGWSLYGDVACYAPHPCVPDTSFAGTDCTAEMPGAFAATKSATCNAYGTDLAYGACVATACAPSYRLDGGACVPISCVPSESLGIFDCAAGVYGAAVAIETLSCNATGDGYVYSGCMVSACGPCFDQVGNSCVWSGACDG